MKNKILQVYGLIMLPVLALIKELRPKKETTIFEVVEEETEKPKRFDYWDSYFKDIIPIEVREERIING